MNPPHLAERARLLITSRVLALDFDNLFPTSVPRSICVRDEPPKPQKTGLKSQSFGEEFGVQISLADRIHNVL